MSLVEAVVVPSAPLLVPALAGGAAHRDAALREQALGAVAALAAGSGSDLVVVGRAPSSACYDGTWDWRGFGLPARVPDQPRLPLALALGDWLLDEVRAEGSRALVGVDPAQGAQACVAQGAALAAAGPVRLLVVGDGSARRSEKAPGHLDARAEAYDAALERALGEGDAAGLLSLDADLGEELLVAGRAPLQVLAGAATGAVDADLLWSGAPYGVTYLVARWAAVR